MSFRGGKRWGLSLLELSLTCSLLLLLGLLCWSTVRLGSRAWLQASARTQRLSAIHGLLRDLQTELEQAPSTAVEGQSGMLAFPSRWALGTARDEQLNPQGLPIWQKYVVLYLQASEVWRREIPVVSTAPESLVPLLLSAVSPPQPLGNYAVGGRLRLAEVESFRCSNPASGCWEVEITSLPIPGHPGSRGPKVRRSYFCHL